MERAVTRSGVGYAKLLLFGEHAAVYGHPAVGLALPGSTRLTARIEKGELRFPNLEPSDSTLLARLLEHLSGYLPSLRALGGEMWVQTTIPRSAGFGSSAALCAALARLVSPEEASRDELWRVANYAERFFHGTPSGVDTGLALLGGLCAFSPSPPDLPRVRPLGGFPLHLVTGALPRSSTTAALVGALRERVTGSDPPVLEGLARLGSIAAQAESVIVEGVSRFVRAGGDATQAAHEGAARLGSLASEAHCELRALGVSSDALDRLLDAGMELGALGGKLSGAGGGGAFYLIYPSSEAADEAARRLARHAERAGVPPIAPITATHWVPPSAPQDLGER